MSDPEALHRQLTNDRRREWKQSLLDAEAGMNDSTSCPLCGQPFEDGPDADPQVIVRGFTVHEGCAADAEPRGEDEG